MTVKSKWTMQSTPEIYQKIPLNRRTSVDTCRHTARWMASRCVPFTAARTKSEVEESRERHSIKCFFFSFFFSRGWRVIRMQRCIQVGALFNTLWLSPYSPDSHPICALFFCSAFLLFKMAVHLSVQLANWVLSLTRPLVNLEHWTPFYHASFHLCVYFRGNRHSSGTYPAEWSG